MDRLWILCEAVVGSLLDKLQPILLPIVENGLVPDFLLRIAIQMMLAARVRQISVLDPEEAQKQKSKFIAELKEMPIAIATDEANQQHYEVPPQVYVACLGRHLKYSCCLYENDTSSLDEAERAALEVTVERAQLKDGQSILELGCGWGSLTLFMAEKFPKAKITAVSNSNPQRLYINERCKERGLTNVNVITANVVEFEASATYDRCISIEMFEHMKNYKKLLAKISRWLKPQGMLFVHHFSHVQHPYHFDADDGSWMARTFFTGGTMPSDDLLSFFTEDLGIVDRWVWNGKHYQKTSEDWLKKLDANKNDLLPVFEETYGKGNGYKWYVNWRLFYLAVAEMFGYNNGNEWVVSHYLFVKK